MLVNAPDVDSSGLSAIDMSLQVAVAAWWWQCRFVQLVVADLWILRVRIETGLREYSKMLRFYNQSLARVR